METKLLFAAKFGELEAQYARMEQRFFANSKKSIKKSPFHKSVPG